jgi:membrane protease YdiL (CAAX protease family)
MGKEFAPARGSDVAFSAGVAYNAGVGEEALYRGYVLPIVRQHVGGREWVANGLQAAVFAAAHGSFSPAAFASHFGFGYYAGYLANHNHGSLRQVVFTHFMWDAVALSGAFLTRQRDRIDPRAGPVVTTAF